MLTQTSIIAIQSLLYVARAESAGPLTPKQIAAALGHSPTYLAKVAGVLVKNGILHAHRGPHGGVTLSRPPAEISILAVVEACQGRGSVDYCNGQAPLREVCAFHQAMLELHRSIVSVLSRWTLADLAARAVPSAKIRRGGGCRMSFLWRTPDRTDAPAPGKTRIRKGKDHA